MSIALRRASEASQLQSTLCDSVTRMFGRRRQKPGNGEWEFIRGSAVRSIRWNGSGAPLRAIGVEFKDWHGDESVKNACAHRGKAFTHFSNVAQNTLPETTSPA